jgi:hypothetical protein
MVLGSLECGVESPLMGGEEDVAVAETWTVSSEMSSI